MAKITIYLDREGTALTPSGWKAKQADQAYKTVRQYDNGVVRLTLLWSGRVSNPQDLLREYWPVFMLTVQNYTDFGTLANDPVEGDTTYPTEADGIAAYNKFLTAWTASTVDAEGTFIEADNDLTPPPPPDPNKPLTEAPPELGDTGAW